MPDQQDDAAQIVLDYIATSKEAQKVLQETLASSLKLMKVLNEEVAELKLRMQYTAANTDALVDLLVEEKSEDIPGVKTD